jgi:hypothetical protein
LRVRLLRRASRPTALAKMLLLKAGEALQARPATHIPRAPIVDMVNVHASNSSISVSRNIEYWCLTDANKILETPDSMSGCFVCICSSSVRGSLDQDASNPSFS